MMALSQVAAFGLISMIAISAFLLIQTVSQSAQALYDSSLQSFKSMQQNAQQTLIHILKVSVFSNTLFVYLANNGSTNLYDFIHFAVIVKYYANVSGTSLLSVSLYSFSKNPSQYQWTSVYGEIFPHTVGVLKIVLPYPPYDSRSGIVVVSTNYGPYAVWSGAL
jgi:hypothetical protein